MARPTAGGGEAVSKIAISGVDVLKKTASIVQLRSKFDMPLRQASLRNKTRSTDRTGGAEQAEGKENYDNPQTAMVLENVGMHACTMHLRVHTCTCACTCARVMCIPYHSPMFLFFIFYFYFFLGGNYMVVAKGIEGAGAGRGEQHKASARRPDEWTRSSGWREPAGSSGWREPQGICGW